MMYIDQYMDKLESVGLLLESFGDNTYAVRSYPTWFPEGLEEEIIRDMVSQIIQNEQVNIEKIREEVAILMACKRSIKANHYLSESEMIKLLDDRSEEHTSELQSRSHIVCRHLLEKKK